MHGDVGRPLRALLLLKPAEQGAQCGDLLVVDLFGPLKLLVGVVRGDLHEHGPRRDERALIHEDLSHVPRLLLLHEAQYVTADVCGV
jgi:hypothetical protein